MSANASGIVVLVVEDNPVNQLLIGAQLDALGYTHELAVSGGAAITMCAAKAYDVVLMDWNLPDLDGMATTDALRTGGAVSPHGGPVPIIAVTASAMSGDRERCLDAGMDDFVSKPVSIEALAEAIARWTGPATASTGDTETEPVAAAPGEGPAETADDHAGDGPTDEIDTNRLIERLGDAEVAEIVIGVYLRELPGRIAAVRAATDAGEIGQLGDLAHTLKSSSTMLGAHRLAEACRALEAAAERGDTAPQCAQLAEVLMDRADATATALADVQRALGALVP